MNEYIVEITQTYAMTVIADNAGAAQVRAIKVMPVLQEAGVTLANLQFGRVIAVNNQEQ